MSGTVSRSKPQLRGLLNSSIKRNLIIALTLSAVSATLVRVFLGNARKEKYAEFYKNYDADAAFERMRKKGVFTCVGDN